MLGLRWSTSEDLSSGAEWNELVKNYKTRQFEIRESVSALRGSLDNLELKELKILRIQTAERQVLDGESSWKRPNQKCYG